MKKIAQFGLALLTASTAAALAGFAAWWVSGLVNALASYLAFTVMHESVHGIAHANKRANAWMGRVAGVLLVGSSRMFRAVHLEHHAHPKVPCALLRADLDVTVSPLVEQNRARPAPLSWAQLCLDDRPRPRMRLRGAA
jgi:fatty acid desaturase